MSTPNSKNNASSGPNKAEKSKSDPKPTEKVKVDKIYSDSEVIMRTEASEKKRNAVLVLLPFRIFKVIWDHVWNPGGRKTGDHLSLYQEITTVGMNTTPVISCRILIKELIEFLKSEKNDSKVIAALKGLEGHLRSIVVIEAENASPEAFKRFWANGVHVEVVQDLSPDQELYLAQDHDTVSRHKETVIRQAIDMLRRSCSIRDVTLKLWDELSTHFSALTGEQKAKIAASPTIAAKIKVMLKIRQGTVQNISSLAVKLPTYCLTAYLRDLSGEDGDKIKLGDARDLHKAQGDVGTKANPTKAFADLYASTVKNYGQASSGPKALSRKARGEFFGQYESPLWELIRQQLEGEANHDFTEIDCQLCDLSNEGKFTSEKFKLATEAIKKRLDAANARTDAA